MSNTAPPTKKIRVNITLSGDVIEMGQALAAKEKRSFSNMVEALFTREAEREKSKNFPTSQQQPA